VKLVNNSPYIITTRGAVLPGLTPMPPSYQVSCDQCLFVDLVSTVQEASPGVLPRHSRSLAPDPKQVVDHQERRGRSLSSSR
jgi:hypothetical protein